MTDQGGPAPALTVVPDQIGAEPRPEPVGPSPAEAASRTEAVIERHRDLVYRIALTHTACRGDADDVFQEVFLTYHRKQPACRDQDHLQAWLITCALNCARRTATSSWRTRVVPLSGAPQPAASEPFTFQTERQTAVFQALAGLPETYRAVIHLFYFDDLPVARIAQLLGLEAGTVKMRLSRGRVRLRQLLQGWSFDD
ncbi:MAG: sigma-70 family RNA polymerase sigma factor [Propionibacteriaceae bacterium]|nr:sigma-70 family RNA polymerase sigma factor [Propionibacteriaceae bacterium]